MCVGGTHVGMLSVIVCIYVYVCLNEREREGALADVFHWSRRLVLPDGCEISIPKSLKIKTVLHLICQKAL